MDAKTPLWDVEGKFFNWESICEILLCTKLVGKGTNEWDSFFFLHFFVFVFFIYANLEKQLTNWITLIKSQVIFLWVLKLLKSWRVASVVLGIVTSLVQTMMNEILFIVGLLGHKDFATIYSLMKVNICVSTGGRLDSDSSAPVLWNEQKGQISTKEATNT